MSYMCSKMKFHLLYFIICTSPVLANGIYCPGGFTVMIDLKIPYCVI